MLSEELMRPELVNLKSIRDLAKMGMDNETAWVIKKDNQYIGALASLLVPNMFNPEITTLQEVMWYILPEHRKSRAGYLLLKQLEITGEKFADEILLSTLSTSEINNATLEKRGFIHVESSFRKVI